MFKKIGSTIIRHKTKICAGATAAGGYLATHGYFTGFLMLYFGYCATAGSAMSEVPY